MPRYDRNALTMPSSSLLLDLHGRVRPEDDCPAASTWAATESLGVVAIGRNEGDRLKRCLGSLANVRVQVYVDSGSTDGSVDAARDLGVEVVRLDMATPFTAARARNAGFRFLSLADPSLRYVQFVDGDCEIAPGWIHKAIEFLDENPEVAAVCGRLRERHPERSVYNWLCDREWDGPTGEIRAFAGNVVLRAQALREVGLYREDVIAAEEDELCVRLRQRGWKIVRLPHPMALHDAAILHLSQWWKRAVRSGYAFAQGAALHGATAERHFVWESRRAWIWGVGLPVVCVGAAVVAHPYGWLSFAIFPLQWLRQTWRGSGALRDRATISLFQLLARFAEAVGQLRYLRDRTLGRQALLIEHK